VECTVGDLTPLHHHCSVLTDCVGRTTNRDRGARQVEEGEAELRWVPYVPSTVGVWKRGEDSNISRVLSLSLTRSGFAPQAANLNWNG